MSFSLVQSANGKVADVEAIVEAAAAHDVLTFCDGTQGIGVHPFDASRFDVTGCHAYKWLCSPRGVGVHDPQRPRPGRAHPDPRQLVRRRRLPVDEHLRTGDEPRR